jgi:hypothetical protein
MEEKGGFCSGRHHAPWPYSKTKNECAYEARFKNQEDLFFDDGEESRGSI